MLKVKRGDLEAFNELVQHYRRPLLNFMYRFTSNPTISEDLAQEVFVRIFQTASRYEPKALFSTWLYRIAPDAALNHIRDERPVPLVSIGLHNPDPDQENSVDPPDARPGIEEQLLERERVQQVRNALTGLPEK